MLGLKLNHVSKRGHSELTDRYQVLGKIEQVSLQVCLTMAGELIDLYHCVQ